MLLKCWKETKKFVNLEAFFFGTYTFLILNTYIPWTLYNMYLEFSSYTYCVVFYIDIEVGKRKKNSIRRWRKKTNDAQHSSQSVLLPICCAVLVYPDPAHLLAGRRAICPKCASSSSFHQSGSVKEYVVRWWSKWKRL